MFRPLKEEDLNTLKNKYPKGTRIKLLKMDNFQAPEIGTLGTVKGVDDFGNIEVSWDTGSSLKVLFNVDKIKKA